MVQVHQQDLEMDSTVMQAQQDKENSCFLVTSGMVLSVGFPACMLILASRIPGGITLLVSL